MDNNSAWIIISSDSDIQENSLITVSTPGTKNIMNRLSISPNLPSLNELGININNKNSNQLQLVLENPFVLKVNNNRNIPKNKNESVSEMIVHIDPSWDLYSPICNAFREYGINFNDNISSSKDDIIIEHLSLYRKCQESNNIIREPFRFGFIKPNELVHQMKNGPEKFTQILDSCCSSLSGDQNHSSVLSKWSIFCYNFGASHHQKLLQISKFAFHDSLTYLQLYSQTKPWISVTKAQDSIINWLVEFIRFASFLPYRKFIDPKETILIGSQTKGTDSRDTFFKMLCEIPQVSEAVAKSICQYYPTLGHLLKAYQTDRIHGENLLANICVTRAKTIKRIGESTSTKIYHVIMGISNGITTRIK